MRKNIYIYSLNRMFFFFVLMYKQRLDIFSLKEDRNIDKRHDYIFYFLFFNVFRKKTTRVLYFRFKHN